MSNNEFEIIDTHYSGRTLVQYTGTDSVVTIPDDVQTIRFRVFENMDFLDTVIIPEGVTSISYEAFKGSSISHLTLPKSVSSLSGSVFESCKRLKTLEIQNPNIHFISEPFKNPPEDFEIIFGGTCEQFKKTAERAYCTSSEYQSGDYHHPSSTQFEYYKAKKYVNIFCRRDEDQFTCRVVCTDGELVYHSMPYKERIVRL